MSHKKKRPKCLSEKKHLTADSQSAYKHKTFLSSVKKNNKKQQNCIVVIVIDTQK